MRAAWRRCRPLLAAAAGVVALLCAPGGQFALAHASAAHRPAVTRPTAHLQPRAQGAACHNPTASLRPVGPVAVTPGSYMAKIRKRGYLNAGVDLNTYHFGYFNPLDGHVEGFDIDMVRAVAAAIFGNPAGHIRFVSLSSAQRIPAIRSGQVDIVARTMTITCARLKQVAFSTVYFEAAQRVLVLRNSPAQDLGALWGTKICATTTSTSLDFLRSYFTVPGTTFVTVPEWTDCLVLLQEGKVAAISTDDVILKGLAAQDPETKIIGLPLTSEPYGLGVSLQHPDFVRFVNAVLARMRADGQWAAIYRRWIRGSVPAPPPARYRD